MNKRTVIYRRGVTAVELMMTVAILGVLALLLPRVFMHLNKTVASASANISAQQNAQVTMFEVNRLLSSARYTKVTITQESGENPYSEIQYLTTDGVVQRLYKSGNQLVHINPTLVGGVPVATPHILLKNGLQTLSFVYPDLNDPKTIQVSITTFNTDVSQRTKTLGQVVAVVHLENQ